MSNKTFKNLIRPTRRQAIIAGIATGFGTLFANRMPVNAQQKDNTKAIADPYEGVTFADGFSRGTTRIGDIELHHLYGW